MHTEGGKLHGNKRQGRPAAGAAQSGKGGNARNGAPFGQPTYAQTPSVRAKADAFPAKAVRLSAARCLLVSGQLRLSGGNGQPLPGEGAPSAPGGRRARKEADRTGCLLSGRASGSVFPALCPKGIPCASSPEHGGDVGRARLHAHLPVGKLRIPCRRAGRRSAPRGPGRKRRAGPAAGGLRAVRPAAALFMPRRRLRHTRNAQGHGGGGRPRGGIGKARPAPGGAAGKRTRKAGPG